MGDKTIKVFEVIPGVTVECREDVFSNFGAFGVQRLPNNIQKNYRQELRDMNKIRKHHPIKEKHKSDEKIEPSKVIQLSERVKFRETLLINSPDSLTGVKKGSLIWHTINVLKNQKEFLSYTDLSELIVKETNLGKTYILSSISTILSKFKKIFGKLDDTDTLAFIDYIKEDVYRYKSIRMHNYSTNVLCNVYYEMSKKLNNRTLNYRKLKYETKTLLLSKGINKSDIENFSKMVMFRECMIVKYNKLTNLKYNKQSLKWRILDCLRKQNKFITTKDLADKVPLTEREKNNPKIVTIISTNLSKFYQALGKLDDTDILPRIDRIENRMVSRFKHYYNPAKLISFSTDVWYGVCNEMIRKFYIKYKKTQQPEKINKDEFKVMVSPETYTETKPIERIEEAIFQDKGETEILEVLPKESELMQYSDMVRYREDLLTKLKTITLEQDRKSLQWRILDCLRNQNEFVTSREIASSIESNERDKNKKVTASNVSPYLTNIKKVFGKLDDTDTLALVEFHDIAIHSNALYRYRSIRMADFSTDVLYCVYSAITRGFRTPYIKTPNVKRFSENEFRIMVSPETYTETKPIEKIENTIFGDEGETTMTEATSKESKVEQTEGSIEQQSHQDILKNVIPIMPKGSSITIDNGQITLHF
jgi:hypothetical protein